MKTFLFAAALASLALAGGCATGGNGATSRLQSPLTITSPSQTNASALYPTEPVTLTATVSNSIDYGRHLEPERHQLHGKCVRDAHADHAGANPGNRELCSAGRRQLRE